MNWWLCSGKLNGRHVFGAGKTPVEAISNAFKS